MKDDLAGCKVESPHGFSMLEVFVCFGIIIVLMGLLLPAVSAARQAAQRVQCSNNLRQIGLALCGYHETFSCYPPGYVSRDIAPEDSAAAETGSGFGWNSLILDFMDQQPLMSSISFESDVSDPASSSAGRTVISSLICASDAGDPYLTATAGGLAVSLARSNYVGVLGYGSLTEQPGAPETPGIFYRNSCVTAFEIADGASNTMVVAERAQRHDFVVGERPASSGAAWLGALPSAFRPAGLTDHPEVWEGPASYVLGTVGQSIPIKTNEPPHHSNFIGAFSSNHPGGLHILLGDGSVRFLSQNVDYDTYRRLGQRSDQQPTGEF